MVHNEVAVKHVLCQAKLPKPNECRVGSRMEYYIVNKNRRQLVRVKDEIEDEVVRRGEARK